MNISSSPHSTADANHYNLAGNVPPRQVCVKALVIGAGPMGLFAARQLEGMQLYHDESVCKTLSGTALPSRKVLVYDLHLSDLHYSNGAKLQSGKKLASFYNNKIERYEPCLISCFNSDRKVDWALCSDLPPGGSWHTFLPSQQTLSDYRAMGFPDYPIEESIVQCKVNRIPQPPEPAPCKRVVTDGKSLVNYYQRYAENLPSDRMVLGKVVSAVQKQSVWRTSPFWEVVIQGADRAYNVECDYLLMAIGRTEPKLLNISGEKDNPYVSHWTQDACRSMDRLNPGGNILVVGNGFSACDTIWAAWHKGLKVTHLLSSSVVTEAKKVASHPGQKSWHGVIEHLNLKRSERHYTVAHAMAYPEKYQSFYEQWVDSNLVGITNGQECLIARNSKGLHAFSQYRKRFDHIALLTGIKADYSFFQSSKPSLFKSDGNADFCPNTMESRGYKNLFFLGCGTEPLLNNALGHAIAATETIRKREEARLRSVQENKTVEQVEEMEWE